MGQVIAELFELFQKWSAEASGELRLNADGSGSIVMTSTGDASEPVTLPVLEWNTPEDGSAVLLEEMTSDWKAARAFQRQHGVS